MDYFSLAVENARAQAAEVIGEEHSPRKAERPDPQWVRATCPVCGEDVVSNCYYVGGKAGGYIILWECWASLGDPSEVTCDYRRVL
jgi:hypothetical protein